jgi:predicted metal-binding membrane protein
MVLLALAGQAALARLPDLGLAGVLCGPLAAASFPAVAVMWAAMTLAMMLPAAVPMIAAYLDIAGAAAEKRVAVVPPIVLAAGYLTVWLAASLVLAGAHWAARGITASPAVLGGLLILAGGWQFSALKHACLTKCRQPMPYFLANWSDAPRRVFMMGIEQGAICLGCCWALMALMFATGAMNTLWMAGLGLAMMLEKTLPRAEAFSRALGFGLMAAGAVMMIMLWRW